MTFDVVDVLVIVTCVAVLCQKVYFLMVLFPKLKVVTREMKAIVYRANKEMDAMSKLTSYAGDHRLDECKARALLMEDVKLMKQWTHDAFVATLNHRRPPEVPAKIIERYGKAGDADHIFS